MTMMKMTISNKDMHSYNLKWLEPIYMRVGYVSDYSVSCKWSFPYEYPCK